METQSIHLCYDDPNPGCWIDPKDLDQGMGMDVVHAIVDWIEGKDPRFEKPLVAVVRTYTKPVDDGLMVIAEAHLEPSQHGDRITMFNLVRQTVVGQTGEQEEPMVRMAWSVHHEGGVENKAISCDVKDGEYLDKISSSLFGKQGTGWAHFHLLDEETEFRVFEAQEDSGYEGWGYLVNTKYHQPADYRDNEVFAPGDMSLGEAIVAGIGQAIHREAVGEEGGDDPCVEEHLYNDDEGTMSVILHGGHNAGWQWIVDTGSERWEMSVELHGEEREEVLLDLVKFLAANFRN